MSTQEEEQLPVVLMHRLPIYNLFFESLHLQTHFTFLDPLLHPLESVNSFLSRHGASIRALISVGHTPVTSQTLALLPALQIVVCSSAGIDHVDFQECRRRGILVTNAGNAFSEDAADYAVALLIDVLRKVSAGNRLVRAGLWPVHGTYPLGSKVGLFYSRYMVDASLFVNDSSIMY